MRKRDALYEKFVMDNATVEDEIRKLWDQLLNEQRKLLVGLSKCGIDLEQYSMLLIDSYRAEAQTCYRE